MFRAKIITIISLIACAFSALGAVSASASWFVGGTELKTSAQLATAAVIDEIPTLLVPAVSDLALTCTGGTLDNASPEIIAGNSVKAQALKFLGCEVTNPAKGCALEGTTISTFPITAVASLGPGEEVRVKYLPQTKNIIAEVEFGEANTCAFNSLESVKGSITEGIPKGQLEAATETLVGLGSVENNSLEVGNSKIIIKGGRGLVKLASGSKWSFK
jgi:hypothetical protein